MDPFALLTAGARFDKSKKNEAEKAFLGQQHAAVAPRTHSLPTGERCESPSPSPSSSSPLPSLPPMLHRRPLFCASSSALRAHK